MYKKILLTSIIIFSVAQIISMNDIEKTDPSTAKTTIESVTISTTENEVLSTTVDPLCYTIDCVYQGNSYPLGFLLAYGCRSLLCTMNGWEDHPANPNCCEFQEEFYTELYILELGCFKFKCRSGNWVWTGIRPECPQCFVSTDPNVYTFDASTYRWYGKCNYTLVQPLIQENGFDSYFPPYGIYGDFGDCGITASCVDVTTYKVNQHTAVEIHHSNLPNIIINGNSVYVSNSPEMATDQFGNTFPVFIWYNFISNFEDYCIVVAGEQYSIVACPTYLIIYTVPETIYGTAGLCGFYSNSSTDDFLLRDGGTFSNYNPTDMGPFVESWMTLEMDFNCVCEKKFTKSTECTSCNQSLSNMCQGVVSVASTNCLLHENSFINFVVESCCSDCCTEFENTDYWMDQAYKFACTLGVLSI